MVHKQAPLHTQRGILYVFCVYEEAYEDDLPSGSHIT